MGCCMSKRDSGTEATAARPATPPQQAIVAAAPAAGTRGDRAPSTNEGDTAGMASAIAHTLADTTPSRTASPPSVPKPAVPNEHYFLPPTVFVPDGSGNDVDFFRAENAALDHAQQGDGNKKKDSSSSSSAKSGAKGESSENLGRLFP